MPETFYTISAYCIIVLVRVRCDRRRWHGFDSFAHLDTRFNGGIEVCTWMQSWRACCSSPPWGACHYLTNRFQMKAPVAPSRSLRGAGLREGFAEPPRRHHEPFAEVYEPFAEVAHTEGSTKTPWRVHEASSKGPWMNLHVPTRS